MTRPNIILTHWREAYHPDHMTTRALVCGASYVTTVPYVKIDHPTCGSIPLFDYLEVDFTIQSTAAEYGDLR
jgi:hypothetical protein